MKNDSDFIPCDSARLQASAWIDGELQASAALALHLERCADCRKHAEDLHDLSARLASLRAAEPAADLWPLIAARAGATPRPRVTWSPRARRIAAAVIGCAGTAALLEATAWLEPAAHVDRAAARGSWPAALHQESTTERELGLLPEQRLLASIEPTPGGQR